MSQPPALRIEGARQNNLKNISVEIPHDRLTVVTGGSCGPPPASHSAATIAETLLAEHAGARALVTFPLPVPAGVPPTEVWAALTRRGFARVRLGAEVVDLAAPPPPTLPGPELDVVLDRVVLAADGRARLVDSLETALREGGGRVAVEVVGGARGAVAAR